MDIYEMEKPEMIDLLKCLIYLAILGILSFPAGRLFAAKTWDPEKFPYREYEWEDGGKIYDRLFNIRKWKDKVPDVSRMFPGIVPRKTLTRPGVEQLDGMIQETCVAELTHLLLCVLAVPVLFIASGWIGIVVFLIDVLFGNLPFVMIQRYNRSRYIRTRSKIESINSKR